MIRIEKYYITYHDVLIFILINFLSFAQKLAATLREAGISSSSSVIMGEGRASLPTS